MDHQFQDKKRDDELAWREREDALAVLAARGERQESDDKWRIDLTPEERRELCEEYDRLQAAKLSEAEIAALETEPAAPLSVEVAPRTKAVNDNPRLEGR